MVEHAVVDVLVVFAAAASRIHPHHIGMHSHSRCWIVCVAIVCVAIVYVAMHCI